MGIIMHGRTMALAGALALTACAATGTTSATSQPEDIQPFAPADSNSTAVLTLTALECGHIDVGDLNVFSDTQAYTGQSFEMVVSCYLIRHGDRIALWDLGLPDAMAETPGGGPGMALTVPNTLVGQLADLGVAPDDVDYIVVSHGHVDHAGNVGAFPNATLVIQAAEWELIQSGQAGGPLDPTLFAEFIDGENVMAVAGDHDLFGDGSVTTITTPGHTPGHQALLVRLENSGPIILSGDWSHLRENRATRGVPGFNWNRADTLASFDRLEALSANLGAPIIIGHDPRDAALLPEAPAFLD
jgi:glyoxylase-like metal-dependent hydrolase (beta-lactamase superfamily II)